MLIAFHKPYGILSQFTPEESKWGTLKEFGFPRGAYAIGRLDAQSEGLLLLSDEGALVDRLLNPRNGHRRIYWAQVDHIPTAESLERLQHGVEIGDYHTLPCRAALLDPQPDLPPRDPPVRFRKDIPTCWIEIELTEGKNHQVRRMTAAVGHPTLRLIRVQIGDLPLEGLDPGEWRELDLEERKLIFVGATVAERPAKRPIARRPRKPKPSE